MPNPSKKMVVKSDIFSRRKRSLIMGAIRGKDTLLETEFRKRLSRAGLKFGKNAIRFPGKPDIIFRKKKLVVFLDGCFWHGCKKHFKIPKTNSFFWRSKIGKNMQRDIKINKFYKNMGWKVLRFWQHDIEKKPDILIGKIYNYLKK